MGVFALMQTFADTSKESLRTLFRTRRRQAFDAEPTLQERIRDQAREELKRRYELGELRQTVGLYWPLPGEVDLTPLRADLLDDFGLSTALQSRPGRAAPPHWLPS